MGKEGEIVQDKASDQLEDSDREDMYLIELENTHIYINTSRWKETCMNGVPRGWACPPRGIAA